MASKNTALILGSGEVYFNPYNPDTLVGEGEIYIGNTPDFGESRALTTADIVTSYDGQLFNLEGAPLKEVLTVNFTTDDNEMDNVGLWFGAIADKQKIAAAVTQSETLIVTQGRHYQLGISALLPSGVRGVSDVSVTINGITVDNSDGLSMIVDYDAARIQILNNAPWFFNGDIVVVTYTYAPQNQATVTPTSREVVGSLRFRATNTYGPLQDYYYPLVKLSPAGDTALKGDAWRTHAFTAEARQLDPYTALVYVTQVDVNPAAEIPSLEPEVLAWYNKQITKDNRDYLVHVNELVRSGKKKGWYTGLNGEFWLKGSKLESSSKNGFKGVRSAANLPTINGGIVYEEGKGAQGDPLRVGYVNTQLRVDQYPGFTLNKHSLYMYVTSNELGSWQEIGASGSGGLKSVMLRASSGFRGGIWSAANQVYFGGGQAVGFSGFSRTSSLGGFSLRAGVLDVWNIFASSLPTAPFTICSAEVSAANSPNRLLMVAIGADLTQQQALDFNEDMDTFVQAIGLYDDIQVPVTVAGPSCFGKETYIQLIPSDFRVIQQANFPTDPTIDAKNYNFFPVTDAIARSTLPYDTSAPAQTDPLAFTTGSRVITITDPGRFDASGTTRISPLPAVGDIVRIRCPDGTIIPPATAPVFTSIHGIPYTEIDKWHIIDSIISDTRYTITVATTAATSPGAGGGAGTIIRTFVQKTPRSTFVVPRSGVQYVWVWSNRGERDGNDPTSPIAPGTILRGNECFPNIYRETGIFTGIQCRPIYKLKKGAVGAVLCATAFQCGYAAYGDPDDPRTWGYMDYAIQYGLDPAKVLPWNWFAVNRETVFNVPLEGFANCYDYVILPMSRLVDMTDFPRLGMCMDMEHADSRDPDLWERDLGRWFEITHAKGMYNAFIGHYMYGSTAAVQGFTSGPGGNAPRLIQHPDCDFWDIISATAESNQGNDPVAFLQAQWDYLTDAAGYIPVEKVIASFTLGIGTGKMSLDDCTRIRAWSDSKGIKNAHVRRAASPQGGSIDKFVNQQQLRYFPNITAATPIDPAGVIQNWGNALANDGYALSFEWEAALSAFVTKLHTALIWDKLGLVQIHGGENIGQALKCLRRLVNGVTHGAPLPLFIAGQGFTFDGVQNYIASGYTPTDADSGMFGDNGLIGTYERTNVSSDGIAAGGYSNITTQGVYINPRSAAGTIKGMINSAPGSAAVADSLGLSIVQRTTAGVYTLYRRGVSAGTFAPGTHGTALSTREVYIGAANAVGVATNFRASQLFATLAGEALTSTEQATLESALTDLATTIGANV